LKICAVILVKAKEGERKTFWEEGGRREQKRAESRPDRQQEIKQIGVTPY
jgi:hypothetical protein